MRPVPSCRPPGQEFPDTGHAPFRRWATESPDSCVFLCRVLFLIRDGLQWSRTMLRSSLVPAGHRTGLSDLTFRGLNAQPHNSQSRYTRDSDTSFFRWSFQPYASGGLSCREGRIVAPLPVHPCPPIRTGVCRGGLYPLFDSGLSVCSPSREVIGVAHDVGPNCGD